MSKTSSPDYTTFLETHFAAHCRCLSLQINTKHLKPPHFTAESNLAKPRQSGFHTNKWNRTNLVSN